MNYKTGLYGGEAARIGKEPVYVNIDRE